MVDTQNWIDKLLGIGDSNVDAIMSDAFKGSMGSDEEREALYQELADMALSGIPLNQLEILYLDYGLRWEKSSVRPLILDTLISQLRRQESINPGATQVDELDKPAPKEGELPVSVLQGMAPLMGPGLLGGLSKAAGVAGSAALATGRAGKYLAMTPFRNPIATSLTFGALFLGTGFGEGMGFEQGVKFITDQMSPEDEEILGLEVSEEELDEYDPSEEPDREGFFMVHGATGRTVQVPRKSEPSITDSGNNNMGYGDALEGYITEENLDRPDPITGDAQEFGTINELYFGDIRLPLDTFPYGVNIRTGEAIRPGDPANLPIRYETPVQLRRFLPRKGGREDDRGTPSNLRRFLPRQDTGGDPGAHEVFVPPGGQINPAAFKYYGNSTILSLIASASERHQIPVELLYGSINAQSGFVINAMTPDGNRVGLAQIDLDDNPSVTRSQALNARFAINWAAQQLDIGIKTYGSFPGGVASMIDPADAKYLSERGEFKNPYTEAFVKDVFGYAQNSGMGRYILRPDDVPTSARRGGGGGGGPKLPAYQAPDPATLSKIVRLTYEDLLKRGATESEAKASVSQLGGLFREQYNAQIAKAQGKASVAVDPQTRFEESIRGGGEFEFRQETGEVRDTMSFMGDLVRIMQGA